MKKVILTICVLLLGSVSTITAQVKLQTNNVDEVLKAMTLEEKAMLIVGGNRQIATTGDNNGMIGGHAQRVPGAAGATQAIPRLGIPSSVLTDGPAGVRINPNRDQFIEHELLYGHRAAMHRRFSIQYRSEFFSI